MGVTATLVVHAKFATSKAARRVKRYLPQEGRVALVQDVVAAEQSLYRVIEGLEYAFVESDGPTTLLCSFEFVGIPDFEEAAITVLNAFRAMEAEELMGVLMATEETIVYVGLEHRKMAVLVPDRTRQEAFSVGDAREIFALTRRILAEKPRRSAQRREQIPRAPKKPVLVLL